MTADKAVVASRQLDLEYTKVVAPVSGRVSRYMVTVGNLVQSAERAHVTLLTTIVSVDPVYAYFDVDERTVQRVRQFHPRRQDQVGPRSGVARSCWAWPRTKGFPTRARSTSWTTRSIRRPAPCPGPVRGVFANKDEGLSAGFFARVRLPIGPPHRALLVSDRALDTRPGPEDPVRRQRQERGRLPPIRVGALHDGLRAIEDGLKPGERVIVNGLQLVRPGITVEPKLVDMPKAKSEVRNAKSETNPSLRIRMTAIR